MSEILTKEKLRKIRKQKGLTQAEFARRIGYSEVYIQKIEQGQSPITDEFTKNFMKAVDIERAYRTSCSNYCDLQEILQEKNSTAKWVFMIILILIFVLIY